MFQTLAEKVPQDKQLPERAWKLDTLQRVLDGTIYDLLQLGAKANKKRAEAFAATLAPVIAEMQTRGLTLRQMAGELTAQGIRTPRGGQWSACGVRNVLLRLAPASA